MSNKSKNNNTKRRQPQLSDEQQKRLQKDVDAVRPQFEVISNVVKAAQPDISGIFASHQLVTKEVQKQMLPAKQVAEELSALKLVIHTSAIPKNPELLALEEKMKAMGDSFTKVLSQSMASLDVLSKITVSASLTSYLEEFDDNHRISVDFDEDASYADPDTGDLIVPISRTIESSSSLHTFRQFDRIEAKLEIIASRDDTINQLLLEQSELNKLLRAKDSAISKQNSLIRRKNQQIKKLKEQLMKTTHTFTISDVNYIERDMDLEVYGKPLGLGSLNNEAKLASVIFGVPRNKGDWWYGYEIDQQVNDGEFTWDQIYGAYRRLAIKLSDVTKLNDILENQPKRIRINPKYY